MKLALALVAALSLAACVDEPTDPGASVSGIAPSKSFTTDPMQLISKDFQQNASFDGMDPNDLPTMIDLSIEQVDLTEQQTNFTEDCQGVECATLGLRMNDTDVLFYNANGKYLGLGHTPRT